MKVKAKIYRKLGRLLDTVHWFVGFRHCGILLRYNLATFNKK